MFLKNRENFMGKMQKAFGEVWQIIKTNGAMHFNAW